jgi:hypothetical protein
MLFAFKMSSRYKSGMKAASGVLILSAFALAGCGAARSVGHVVTTPARVVERQISGNPPSGPVRSDVDVPGAPVAGTPAPSPRLAQKGPSAAAKASPSATPRTGPSQPQFPVAKAVPGKPGLVYNPFDANGALIDVTGYAAGSKVKDPDSQKIFIVP